MWSAAKLGTRALAGATIAATLALGAGIVTTDASAVARVTPFTAAGAPGFGGDGGPAIRADLASPAGVAVDAAGDIAIADTDNCRVRYVPSTAGVHFGVAMRRLDIYTIAGSACGSSRRDGRATGAELSFPSDVAFDGSGDVLVSDTGNNEIRMVSKNGEISTIAGNGKAGSAGDGRPATDAELDAPSGIAVDDRGNVFIADTNNCRVREVAGRQGLRFGEARAPGIIGTAAGNGTCGHSGDGGPASRAELFTPGGVAVDSHGDLLIADTGNRLVREVAAGAGSNFGVAMTPGGIYPVAGSGTYNPYFGDGLAAVGDASSLSFPTGIAVDASGDLFVADTYLRGVREIPAAAGTSFGTATQADAVYTVAGAGPPGTPNAAGTANDAMVYPSRIALDPSGDVFVADIGNNSVERLEHAPH